MVGTDAYYKGEDSDGQYMAKTRGLGVARPIMCAERRSGSLTHLFEADNKYYFWNMIEDSVSAILEPKELKDIVASMARDGMRSIETKPVARVDS